jgi:NAD(P)-dependent dehydrogenase (short-subunit alcohol dehydrogenase family)
MRNLYRKKCLITGAASGIGRATAQAASRQGALLILTDINGPALEAVAKQIRADGGQVLLTRALDISSFEAVRDFAGVIHAVHGSIDVLMNIAGIAVWGSVEQLRHEQWRRAIDINLMGPIHTMECFLPEMIRAGRGGHLVNVSSAAGLFGLPWHAPYSASKFGLRGVSEVLRFDLRRHRIGVSLVCPGGVDTGLVNTVEIEGIRTDHPDLAAFKKHFRRLAVSPERAAQAILAGIKANRYMVYTSGDIRLLHWAQCLCNPIYILVMRLLNSRFHALLDPLLREQGAPAVKG